MRNILFLYIALESAVVAQLRVYVRGCLATEIEALSEAGDCSLITRVITLRGFNKFISQF